jgi:hypothetical protein
MKLWLGTRIFNLLPVSRESVPPCSAASSSHVVVTTWFNRAFHLVDSYCEGEGVIGTTLLENINRTESGQKTMVTRHPFFSQ